MRRASLATTWAFAMAIAASGCDRVFQLGELPDARIGDADIVDDYVAECTTSAQCTAAAEPVCGADQVCRACVAHSECPSNACLPTGACGDDATVVYVNATTGDDVKSCSKSEPCKKLAVAATKGKPFIKVETNLDEAITLTNVNVTILAAPSTQITRTSAGATNEIFKIGGPSNVRIYDVVITGGVGTSGHGISVGVGDKPNVILERVKVVNNDGVGLNFLDGRITASRSIVSRNRSGGVIAYGTFDITNTLIVANGGTSSATGGFYANPAAVNNVFSHNTIAHNTANTLADGMDCNSPITSTSSIIEGDQVGTNCMFAYSLFPNGTNVSGSNRTGAPQFKATDASDPFSGNYYRIDATSAAIGGADPASPITIDIDGDTRPQSGSSDIGADEYK